MRVNVSHVIDIRTTFLGQTKDPRNPASWVGAREPKKQQQGVFIVAAVGFIYFLFLKHISDVQNFFGS